MKSDTQTQARGVQRLASGIRGLDEVLGGGLPAGRATVIAGAAGTGKTVLLNEFLYRGIAEYDQAGVFVTFEEKPEDIARNVYGFGWNYDELIASNRLAMVDLTQQREPVAGGGSFDWDVLFKRIEHAIDKISAKRVVVDSISSAFGRYSSLAEDFQIREMLYRLMDTLKSVGVTTLVSAERPNPDATVSRYGIEEFVADGAMNLSTHFGQNRIIRTLSVIKMRGVDFRSGRVEFDITNDGIEVFPKIPVDTSMAKTDFDVRLRFGIEQLDSALGGGVPQGHMFLSAGNTGTGKTLLGLHFVKEGLAQGEKAVWVALEEPVPQVRKTALAMGWDLDACDQDGALTYVRSELLDVSADRLLYTILRAVEQTDAKRVVLDSVSSLESSVMDRDKVRELLIQLSTTLKTRGVTCLLNYLAAESFGASSGQLLGSLTTNEMRLSSIVDGILLLRYVERDQEVKKLLNVIKLRGSSHSRDIREYRVTDQGIVVGDRFAEAGKDKVSR